MIVNAICQLKFSVTLKRGVDGDGCIHGTGPNRNVSNSKRTAVPEDARDIGIRVAVDRNEGCVRRLERWFESERLPTETVAVELATPSN